jgi:GNAT superfamily N-acetyltransferase
MTLSTLVESKTDKERIREIYVSSFPSYERMPFFMLVNSAKKNNGFDLLGIYDNDALIGFFYVILQNDICLILYFAIDAQRRSRGFGSQALELIKEHYMGKRIFLYIEQINSKAQNHEQQIKRKDFYLRNGFVPGNFNIILSKNVFEVLISGKKIAKGEYVSILKKMTGGINFAKVVNTSTNG